MSEEPVFAIIVPTEAEMSAPVAAGSELTKLYAKALQKFNQLAEQTRIVREKFTDENGVERERIIVYDHKDLKWWFEAARKILTDIGHLTSNIQIKDIENKIKITDMFLRSGILTKEQQIEFVKMAQKNKLVD